MQGRFIRQTDISWDIFPGCAAKNQYVFSVLNIVYFERRMVKTDMQEPGIITRQQIRFLGNRKRVPGQFFDLKNEQRSRINQV